MQVRRMPGEALSLMAAATFTAGALSIVLEMLLLKLATRYTGSGADGTTAALTLFLLGLLAGAALTLKLNQTKASAVSRYIPCILPVLLAACAPVLALASGVNNDFGGQNIVRQVFCALLIFAPACLTGMIFPAILLLCARFYFGSDKSFEESQGNVNPNKTIMLLYLVSNLGSALGATGTAIWLLPAFGIAKTLSLSAIGWLAVALLLAPFVMAGAQASPVVQNLAEGGEFVDFEDAIVTINRPFTYGCIFAAALAGLIFECLTIRILNLVCGASFLTTTCAITATLLAIAISTRLSIILPTNKNTRLNIAVAMSVAATGLAMTVLLLPHLSNIFQALRQLADGSAVPGSAEPGQHARYLAYLYPRLIMSLVVALPAASGLSLLFPLTAKGVSRPADMLRLYIAAGAGTVCAPLFYLAMIGRSLPNMPSSIDLLLRLLTIAAVVLTIVALGRKITGQKGSINDPIIIRVFCLLGVAFAASVLMLSRTLNIDKLDLGLSFVPTNLPIRAVIADQQLSSRLFYKEGRTAAISVLKNVRDNTVTLRSDGKIEGTIPVDFAQPSLHSDQSTQSLLALLPLLRREAEVHTAFLIGYGTGTTAATMALAAPKVDLQIAEIEPAVVEAGKYFERNTEILAKKQNNTSHVTTGDARQILQDSPKQYDLIISQPAEPWVQGSTNLYSLEFYQLVKKRLSASGNFCQWLQLYGLNHDAFISALWTFKQIFPNCLIFHQRGAGEILIVGYADDAATPPQTSQWRQLFMQKNAADQQNLKLLLTQAGINNLEQLDDGAIIRGADLNKRLADASASHKTVLISDDNLALELACLPEIEKAGDTIKTNLALLFGKKACQD